MTLWILDLRCLACPWSERCTHPVGDRLTYVCPQCKSPINSYRLIGPVEVSEHEGGLEVAA